MIRKFLPDFVKPLLRFVIFRHERKRFFEELKIKKNQNNIIKGFDKNSQSLIVFLIPGLDKPTRSEKISGGIMSIVSLFQETRKIKSLHGFESVLVTFPGEYLLYKHEQFENKAHVLRFEQIADYFGKVTHVLVHVPEFLCDHFLRQVANGKLSWLIERKHLKINILNQNIRLMPSISSIDELRNVSNYVTITTAHHQYCNLAWRQFYGVPLHLLSVWISPEKYRFVDFSKKENIIVVSPDQHPEKNKILKLLSEIKDLKVQVIKDLTYENYKELISRAKWSLTFGEGLDGYFIEPIFSGAISFAIFNSDFFTEDFSNLKTVFHSYDAMADKLVTTIQSLDHSDDFSICQTELFYLCSKYYSHETYVSRLGNFYNHKFTYA